MGSKGVQGVGVRHFFKRKQPFFKRKPPFQALLFAPTHSREDNKWRAETKHYFISIQRGVAYLVEDDLLANAPDCLAGAREELLEVAQP